MTGPSTSPSATGQEGRVTDEMVERAAQRMRAAGLTYVHLPVLRAALAAVAPDIAAQARADGVEEGRGDMENLERKWRAEARRECAEDLLSTRSEYRNHHIELYERLGDLAARWSGSGRTPAAGGPS